MRSTACRAVSRRRSRWAWPEPGAPRRRGEKSPPGRELGRCAAGGVGADAGIQQRLDLRAAEQVGLRLAAGADGACEALGPCCRRASSRPGAGRPSCRRVQPERLLAGLAEAGGDEAIPPAEGLAGREFLVERLVDAEADGDVAGELWARGRHAGRVGGKSHVASPHAAGLVGEVEASPFLHGALAPREGFGGGRRLN